MAEGFKGKMGMENGNGVWKGVRNGIGKGCGTELGRMVSGIGLREGTRLVRVGGVEGLEKVRSVSKLRSREPGGFFISAFVTSPSDEVLELASASFVDLGIKDFADFKLEFAVNFDRRRRSWDATRDFTGSVELEHGDVEHGVNSTHGVRESESPGLGTDLADDFVRT